MEKNIFRYTSEQMDWGVFLLTNKVYSTSQDCTISCTSLSHVEIYRCQYLKSISFLGNNFSSVHTIRIIGMRQI